MSARWVGPAILVGKHIGASKHTYWIAQNGKLLLAGAEPLRAAICEEALPVTLYARGAGSCKANDTGRDS